MSNVDAAIVFLPRFTTLVGQSTFKTKPLDVSRFGSAQFQLWRGPLGGTTPTFDCYLEESLDAEHWVLGPSTPEGFDPGPDTPKFFSYGFRLRWFRLRIELAGTSPTVTCWAEGLLRGGGGGGAWPTARRAMPAQPGAAGPRRIGSIAPPPSQDLMTVAGPQVPGRDRPKRRTGSQPLPDLSGLNRTRP